MKETLIDIINIYLKHMDRDQLHSVLVFLQHFTA